MINNIQRYSKLFQSKQNLAIIMGDDFCGENSFDSFNQLDKLLELTNKI